MVERQEHTRPLTPRERERFLTAIEERGELLDELIGRGLLYTGVNALTLAHMRADWIHETPKRLEIRIPNREIECIIGDDGGTPAGKVTGDPCGICVRDGGTWEMRRYKPRRIPMGDDRTQEVFRRWFNLYDVVGGVGMISKRIDRYADWAEIDRLSPGVLRWTFAVILVEKRFPLDVCTEVLGYRSEKKGRARIRHNAQYADGGTPFVCGTTGVDGSECARPVKTLDECCWQHR